LSERLRITVVGNGNAGAALVDSLLAKDAAGIEITLYGGEKVGTYDRVRLSEYIAGSVDLEDLGMRSDDWYEEQNVDFRRGILLEEIDTKEQRVRGTDDEWVEYDRLILATGSSSSVPPSKVETRTAYSCSARYGTWRRCSNLGRRRPS